ncbi:MAG TPA: hypothetical protein VGK74_13605 [Symbiobacteriaceae bacterium]|jgi:predicted small lipoprotein YifL
MRSKFGKPLLLMLALLLTACSRPGPAKRPPDEAPTPAETAPSRIQRLFVAYLHKEADPNRGDVFVTPPVTTLHAVAPAGLQVEFYGRSATAPVRYLGKARAVGDQYSLLWTVPRDLAPPVTVWAWVGPEGDPAMPPPRTPVIAVRPAPAGSKVTDVADFPLFPAFNWHTDLTAPERTELTDWLKAGWEQETRETMYGGRLQDVSTVEVLEWTTAEARTEGWEGLTPVGGGDSWSLEAHRGSVRVQVNFARASGGILRAGPEPGYGMVVRVLK